MRLSVAVMEVEDNYGQDDGRSHHEHDTVEIGTCDDPAGDSKSNLSIGTCAPVRSRMINILISSNDDNQDL